MNLVARLGPLVIFRQLVPIHGFERAYLCVQQLEQEVLTGLRKFFPIGKCSESIMHMTKYLKNQLDHVVYITYLIFIMVDTGKCASVFP